MEDKVWPFDVLSTLALDGMPPVNGCPLFFVSSLWFCLMTVFAVRAVKSRLSVDTVLFGYCLHEQAPSPTDHCQSAHEIASGAVSPVELTDLSGVIETHDEVNAFLDVTAAWRAPLEEIAALVRVADARHTVRA